MDKIITLLLNFTGTGWKGYAGGVFLLIAGVAFGADYVAQLVGMDVLTDRVSTWAEAVGAIGAGLSMLGVRHKQSKQDETIQAQTVAVQEQTEASEELTDALDSLPQKGKK